MSLISNTFGMFFGFILADYLGGGETAELSPFWMGVIFTATFLAWMALLIAAMVCDSSIGGGDKLKGGK